MPTVSQCSQCSPRTPCSLPDSSPALGSPAGLRGRVWGVSGRVPAPAPCPLPVPDRAHAGACVHPKASVYLGVPLAAAGGTCLAPAAPALPTYNYLQPPHTYPGAPRGRLVGWVPQTPMGAGASESRPLPKVLPRHSPFPSLPHPKTPAKPPP